MSSSAKAKAIDQRISESQRRDARMHSVSRQVNAACEAWLRNRGVGTKSWSQHYHDAKDKKGT